MTCTLKKLQAAKLKIKTFLALAGTSLFLLSGCSWFLAEPEKNEPPETMISDTAQQYFFPHGQLGRVLIRGNVIMTAASWTRGDGIEFFHLKNPDGLFLQPPEYADGLISAGYTTDAVRKGEFAYIATSYSIMTVRFPEIGADGKLLKKAELLENTLIAFPNGGVNVLKISGNYLYVNATDGVRKYRIGADGRLTPEEVYAELRNLSTFAVSGNMIYAVAKSNRRELLKMDVASRNITRQAYQSPVNSIVTGADGFCCVLPGNGKLMQTDGRESSLYGLIEQVKPGMKQKKIIGIKQLSENVFGVTFEGMSDDFYLNICDGQKTIKYFAGFSGSNYAYDPDTKGIVAKLGTNIIRHTTHHAGMDTTFYQGCGIRALALTDLCRGSLPEGGTPLIQSEGPVFVRDGFVYSLDNQNGSTVLYGFDARKPQESMDFDVLLSWKNAKMFYYDIVLPPFCFYPYGEKYVFAPGALLDMSKPGEPVVAAKIDVAASCIKADGKQRIFLAQGDKLTVLDGTKLPEITPLAVIPKDDTIKLWTEFELDGNYLFAHGRKFMAVYDISNLNAVKPVAKLDLPCQSYRMVKHGKHLYLPPYSGGADSKFCIVNISDPAKPGLHIWEEFGTGKSLLGIMIKNDKMYLAANQHVTRYTLKNPLKPSFDKSWTAPDKAMQGYYYADLQNGCLAGKKYPRIDVWRIEE